MADLPAGWSTRDSSTQPGYFYYYNADTGVSQWERPAVVSKVRASHLLVKHKESRNPSSWRESRITRTKEEAAALINQYRSQLGKGAVFGELCQKYSDCNSAKSNGDLGFFGRGEMQKPFEEAAFGLKVGEVSNVVETQSGLHIIQRTA